MTSQGNAYSRFRRALLTGNVTIIDAAARELPGIALEDALRILRVLAEKGDPRFEKAAARFAARAIAERFMSPAEGHEILALAQALPQNPDAVGAVLARRCAAARPKGSGNPAQPDAG